MAKTTSIPKEYVVEYGVTVPQSAIGDGLYDGQTYYQVGGVSQGFRHVLWLWDLTSTVWQAIPMSPIQGTGNPNGVTTPDAIGQTFFDLGTGNFYLATGITNNDWTLTN